MIPHPRSPPSTTGRGDQLRQAINQIKQREKHGESTLQVGSSSSSSA
jgi:hypothetical protein